MNLIECLEARRLLVTFAPDVTWGDDGFLSRADDPSFVGTTPLGVFAEVYPYTGIPSEHIIRRYNTDGTLAHEYRDLPEFNRVQVDAEGRLYLHALTASPYAGTHCRASPTAPSATGAC